VRFFCFSALPSLVGLFLWGGGVIFERIATLGDSPSATALATELASRAKAEKLPQAD
jgi:hypothetical protein